MWGKMLGDMANSVIPLLFVILVFPQFFFQVFTASKIAVFWDL